jgi:branched-chain amino acid transport system ATP-binding protein
METPSALLTVAKLTTSYSGIEAVRGASIEVREGHMVALIGPNGAGKTTLLNSVSGVVRPAAGSIMFGGFDITGWPAYRVARAGLLQVPEGRQILGPLSVEDNLELGRLATGTRQSEDGNELARVYDLFPILKERRTQVAGSLSGGEQQMLAIARALMGRPRLLLLDEPSLGLAPIIVGQVFDSLRQLNADGLTILLVEQNVERALKSSRYAYVMERGQVVHQGESAALLDDPKIAAHYLGRESVPTV